MPQQNDNEVHGGCYCGNVRFLIPGTAQPLLSGYCHCVACRQAHAAPMYAVAWLSTSDFSVTKGEESLKWYTRSQMPETRLQRYFCLNCGTKVFNAYDGPFGDQRVTATGIFPSLFDDQSLVQGDKWAPRIHMHCEESVIDLSLLNDGLPKLPKGAAAT